MYLDAIYVKFMIFYGFYNKFNFYYIIIIGM